MNDQQPRVQNGLQGAGQWASHTHPESQVQLFDRMDGTFLHPAPFKTASSCIAFWSTVEIPDQIIDQFTGAYAEMCVREIDIEMGLTMGAWEQTWIAENPQPKKEKDIPEWEAKFQSERESYRLEILPQVEQGLLNARPDQVGRYDAPQLVRAAQMWIHAPNGGRFPEEEAKVSSHAVELFDGVLTVDEIETKYRLSQLQEAIRRIIVEDPMEKLVESLDTTNDRLLDVHKEIIRTNHSGY